MKTGGSGGGNSFVTAEVLLMIWKIFPSPPLQPKVAAVNKHLSQTLSHVHVFFLCIVPVMTLVNGSHVPMPLLRLSNCHDQASSLKFPFCCNLMNSTSLFAHSEKQVYFVVLLHS